MHNAIIIDDPYCPDDQTPEPIMAILSESPIKPTVLVVSGTIFCERQDIIKELLGDN